MITPARLHSDLSRLGRETDMFFATVASLSDDEMAAASLCEGWSRAHVIAHVAANGRALVQLIDWAAAGEERRLYASPEARAGAISALAALPREELLEELGHRKGVICQKTRTLQLSPRAKTLHLPRSQRLESRACSRPHLPGSF